MTIYSPIKIISSMATRQLLADLVALRPPGAMAVEVESVGGVDAARRVRAGEAFDAIVLASNVVDQLIAEGHAMPGSRVDIVQSGVHVAVRAGATVPDIASEDAVRAAVLAAPSLGYSTGPSGVYLTGLFERWGILEQIKPRIVQAPAGVPVGSLVAKGEVALGFQQLSELMNLSGVTVVGPLPPGLQLMTTFSGCVSSACRRAAQVGGVLGFMASPETVATKHRNGMQPA